jgi:hypothetical protein
MNLVSPNAANFRLRRGGSFRGFSFGRMLIASSAFQPFIIILDQVV